VQGARWRDIPVIVIASRDLDPKDREKDRERLNSGVQSLLIKDTFRPVDLSSTSDRRCAPTLSSTTI
jgi:hypothetical protein